MTQSPPLIDVPFALRHTCWFCAEPSNCVFEYHASVHTPHSSLGVPACKECLKLAKKSPLTSIWDCQMAVKDELMRIYAKHLAIGINWTEQELIDSEFSCRVFEGFKKSAWMMYLIARDRVNANGWPLSLDGVDLDNSDFVVGFEFDGVKYASLSKAVNHYSQILGLDKHFFEAVLSQVGRSRFGYAVRISRINIVSTKRVKQEVVKDIAIEQGTPLTDNTWF
ncbi:hypothetical protein [Shewanella violacea]|uniref:Uncharacterized protein n=1 Tax=Shewanella violacea (strain JCM 10179 / CIP 106290 / LMG 19151 / DSS12) TaxID=637905 RepID=D4ZLM7_SHEVD|nr:hypothetical protein [Shewanella violacea]BAJ02576.1 conserved hypothetical protein [Shewanella violacea DSS12]